MDAESSSISRSLWKIAYVIGDHIDYFGILRKDWEYVKMAREWLKTLPVLRSLPSFMWPIITFYSLIMTQVTTLIFVCAWTFWNVLYPIKEYYESMAHAQDRPDLRNISNEQM